MADAQTMELSLSNVLIVYGPLGIGWVVSMIAAIRLYRDNQALRTQCEAEKKVAADANLALQKATAEENSKLQERYIAKAETWMEKYGEVATSAVNVVRAATKRSDLDGDRDRAELPKATARIRDRDENA